MTYQEKQEKLFNEIEEGFKHGEIPSTLVPQSSDYASDNQICLTSAVFVDDKTSEEILSKVIKPLKAADDSQYYYVSHSLHLTITNVRTVNFPPLFTPEDIDRVKPVFRGVVSKYKAFTFYLKGLFELPTSVAVRAYSDEVLGDLVLELRNGLAKAGVPDNKTYASSSVFFSNVSVCRYTTKPKVEFNNIVRKLKTIDIGKMKAEKIYLITTSSVCQPEKTTIIDTFVLG